VPVSVPDGRVSLNALPWAEVLIDGRPVGTTPLANLAVPIGHHEVVFRHPQFGERKQNLTVTATTPARIGINLQ
jgi:serine/threonine-protein kinase